MSLRGRGASSQATAWLDLTALLDPVGRQPEPPLIDSPERWLAVYRLSTAHLVSPSLYANLRARGWLDILPADIRDALEALHTLNKLHNEQLSRVLRETVGILNGVGIEPVLLKGAIALLPGQYVHAADRMLGDLDLAVGALLDRGCQALEAAGFRFDTANHPPQLLCWDEHHHAPPLLDPSGVVYVELHRSILGRSVPERALPMSLVESQSRALNWEGVGLRVPSLEHRLVHASLHKQLQDQALFSDRRSMRHLLEFTRLCALPEAETIDWARTLARLDRLGVGDALRVDLLSSYHQFGQSVPPGVQWSATALAVEGRFWLRLNEPDLDRQMARRWRISQAVRRLRRLPQRLMSKGWLAAKLRHAYVQWKNRRLAKGTPLGE